MNVNRIIQIFLGFLGFVSGIVVIASILTGGGNNIGAAAKFGLVGCFFIGLLAPRPGFVLMLLLAGYSDFLKRLMILETSLTMLDLVYVLGLAPATLAGVTVSVLVKRVFSKSFTKRDVLRFLFCCLALLAGVAMGLMGDSMKSLRVVADYGVFAFVLFVVPILYPTRSELTRVLKVALMIFVPVAIYGIWQRTVGLSDFEYRYLLSGMSGEERQLADVEVRPFSTLNAATSLTMVMAGCVMAVILVRQCRRIRLVTAVLYLSLFIACCIATFTRVGWLATLAGLALIPLFRRRWTTSAVYLIAVGAFLFLVVKAEWFRDNLKDWQGELYEAADNSVDSNAQGFRIMTLSDRLIGFENLKNPDNWKPFGVRGEGRDLGGLRDERYTTTFSHDAFTRFLFSFGYVPTFLVVALVGGVVCTLHRKLFKIAPEQRKFGQTALAGVFGMLTSLVTGNVVFQFPTNIFFWMLVSAVIVAIQESGQQVEEAREGIGEERLRSPGGFAPEQVVLR